MTLPEIQDLSDEDLRVIVAELCGYPIKNPKNSYIPYFPICLSAMYLEEKRKGLHFNYTSPDYDPEAKDPAQLALRVKWSNNLRRTFEKTSPKNKSGWPIISDVDLLLGPSRNRAEAFVLTFQK